MLIVIKLPAKKYKMMKEIIKSKILIIEDDNQSRYLLTFLLESNNYEVIQSTNGLDGIANAKNFKPTAIILDIQLPEMNGYEVAKELKKSDETRNIPIIVVTSFAMNRDKIKALEAGADGFIVKPIDPDTFILKMESFIPSLCK
jgi:two-component system, cell cycle response regulator DivK